MKKKNRELNAFSISALDLFCSAMGVFMLICFIVMNKQADEAKPVEIPPHTKVIKSLTLILSWDVKCTECGSSENDAQWQPLALGDIDMVVRFTDDSGKQSEFTPKSRSVKNYNKALYAADSVAGGADVWSAATAIPGKYEIYYHIASTYTGTGSIECHDKRYDGQTKRFNINGYRIRLKAVSSTEITQSNQPDKNDPGIIAEKEFGVSQQSGQLPVLTPGQPPVLFATLIVDTAGNISVTLPTSEISSQNKS